MDVLRKWSMIFCTVSVVSAIMYFLIPNGKIQKSVKTVISLFMLTVLLWPISVISGKDIFDIDVDFAEQSRDAYDYSLIISQYAVKSGESAVETEIGNILNKICVGKYDVDAKMRLDGDGNIELYDILITITPDDSGLAEKIKEKVGSETGIIPTLKIEEDYEKTD